MSCNSIKKLNKEKCSIFVREFGSKGLPYFRGFDEVKILIYNYIIENFFIRRGKEKYVGIIPF